MRQRKKPSKRREAARNRLDKMSFAELFDTEEYLQHLEALRPAIAASFQMAFPSANFGIPDFTHESDADEEVIMSRFRDYLVHLGDDPQSFRVPVPGLVLREFLNSLGKVEMAVWDSLPVDTLLRAARGKTPISDNLSARVSEAFGTRTEFWVEMQREYDDWRKHPTRHRPDGNAR